MAFGLPCTAIHDPRALARPPENVSPSIYRVLQYLQHRVVRRIMPFDAIVLPDSTASMGRVRGKPEGDLRARTHADGP